ncbi:ribosome small subunit-dependent GTPase A [Thiospirillum jenense]|uniref:Small ribosomal subunit biogenesis GTPase RsgA n=1 Tax=Thiospirillum jenense TaxID=1653858 RepID=A0A839HHA2_9GAMM|nr:ribosome small subunit-dependent GTPase A [Thiospirillum jenense]MBB1126229.1 ribosome small subunit-dependent GTPase A [Thiospirillum jenense]
MPRRALSKQQARRINAAHERRQQLEAPSINAMATDDLTPQRGQVIVRYGAECAVMAINQQLYHCTSRQHLGHLVCGDEVIWQPTGNNSGVITALLPRHTVLSRPDYSGRDKPLAANVTLMVIVIAPEPLPSNSLIDQYLIAAELIGVATLIVCNKIDLLTTAAATEFISQFDYYPAIGYALLPMSAVPGAELTMLMAHLQSQTAIFVGQSGVGKSSLIAALLPDQAVQIGQLSAATGLGRHTTSAATYYYLPTGGGLIDSPGVRSFRLKHLTLNELERGFREFAPYLQQCRFNDCQHRSEPGCAINAAVTAGQINPQRLSSFHSLVNQYCTG